jgi:hypothetical protein
VKESRTNERVLNILTPKGQTVQGFNALRKVLGELNPFHFESQPSQAMWQRFSLTFRVFSVSLYLKEFKGMMKVKLLPGQVKMVPGEVCSEQSVRGGYGNMDLKSAAGHSQSKETLISVPGLSQSN